MADAYVCQQKHDFLSQIQHKSLAEAKGKQVVRSKKIPEIPPCIRSPKPCPE